MISVLRSMGPRPYAVERHSISGYNETSNVARLFCAKFGGLHKFWATLYFDKTVPICTGVNLHQGSTLPKDTMVIAGMQTNSYYVMIEQLGISQTPPTVNPHCSDDPRYILEFLLK